MCLHVYDTDVQVDLNKCTQFNSTCILISCFVI